MHSVFPITREQFIQQDTGGALYKLSSKNFTTNEPQSEYEYVSEHTVTPIEKEIFESSLDTMEKEGIVLHFLGSMEKIQEYWNLNSSKERIKFIEENEI